MDKLRWRAFFKDSDDRPFFKKMQYSRATTPFRCRSAAGVEDLVADIHGCILDATRFGISRSRKRRKSFCNVLDIEYAARCWILISDWVPIPTDKDGGFTLVRFCDLLSIQKAILNGPWYSYYGYNCILQTWKCLRNTYVRLAKEVTGIDERVTMTQLCASLSAGADRLPSLLINTCKTHKPSGSVAFRPVHSSAGHAYLGLMSWISMVLSDALAKWTHLVPSSDCVIRKLKHLQVAENDIFLHMDLKDFYMTGDSDFLVFHCSLLVPFKLRSVFRKVLKFLLSNQYVSSRLYPRELWRVRTGSGIGLRSSADVSNAAFLHAVELCGLALLTKASRERFGIKFYCRYFDNLLFICKPEFDRIKNLKYRLENGIKPYVSQLEEASHIAVTFLDVTFCKDDICWKRSGVLSYFPMLKATSLQQVLSTSSDHLPSTHVAWMNAFMTRLRSHSSSIVWYRTMQEHVVSRLRKSGIDHAIILHVLRTSRFAFPSNNPFVESRVVPSLKRARCLYIRLPFHGAWRSAIDSALRALCEDPEFRTRIQLLLGSNVCSIRPAWMLNTPTLANSVSKI